MPNLRLPAALCALLLCAACTSDKATTPAGQAANDWCASHGVPESQCTRCNPELIPAFRAKGDWCAGHGLPESQCLKCNPELADNAKKKDWCAGHGVPESQCTRCNPALIPAFQAKGDWCAGHGLPESQCLKCNPELASGQQKDWCAEHGLPESQCTKCNPSLTARYLAANDFCREHGYPASACPVCAGTSSFPPEGMRVRLASTQTAADAGIATARAETRRHARTLEVVGALAFDPNRSAEITATAESVIRAVHVDIGDTVRAGDPLVTLASAGVGAARAELAAARTAAATATARLERERQLHERGIVSRQELEATEREAADARRAVLAAQASLDTTGASRGTSGGSYVLRAPAAGTVVSRDATAGRTASPGEVLVRVADTATLHANLSIPERDAGAVARGQQVELLFDGGRRLATTLERVAPAVDPATRTVAARALVANPDGALKAGAFVRARLAVEQGGEAVWIPRAAVQRAEGKHLVFVQEAPAVYRPVAVELGATEGDRVEVKRGLAAGDPVVTTGAFLLVTEVRKDAIGAGCCEVE